jgi:hypothetical protein
MSSRAESAQRTEPRDLHLSFSCHPVLREEAAAVVFRYHPEAKPKDLLLFSLKPRAFPAAILRAPFAHCGRARLQPCRKEPQISAALAAEGSLFQIPNGMKQNPGCLTFIDPYNAGPPPIGRVRVVVQQPCQQSAAAASAELRRYVPPRQFLQHIVGPLAIHSRQRGSFHFFFG